MAGFTWEEAVGEKPEKKPAEKSSGGGGFTWEEAGGGKGTSRRGARRVFDEAVNVADLVLSTPAFVSGTVADTTSRGLGVWERVLDRFLPNPWVTEKSKPFLRNREEQLALSRRDDAQQALHAYETAMKYGGNLASRLLGVFGYEPDVETTYTGKALEKIGSGIEKAGEWVEGKTGGGVLKEDVQSMANTAMLGLPAAVKPAVKGLKAGYRAVTGRAEPGSIEIPQGVLGEPVSKGLPGAPERMTLGDLAKHYQETIDTQTAMTKQARRQRAAELRKTFEQGKTEAGETLAQLQARLDESARQSERYHAEEAARERMDAEARSYETQGSEVPDLTQSDLLRIMQKRAFERTAEDLVALREARNRAMGLGIGAAGLAALADDSEDSAGAAAALGLMASSGGFRGLRRQIGAVKLPGGMWHPEAVERLSDPLANKLLNTEFKARDLRLPDEQLVKMESPGAADLLKELNADRRFVAWSDRAVRNWLNRHAGTAGDPLKDVQIPFGEGTRRWEELTDLMIGSREQSVLGLNKTEHVFDLRGPFGQGENAGAVAIRSYLSHVGDYLRQNVPPEKLQQYDLPRAVRETALNDARVAKAMEKEAQSASAGLPTYAEYADGFKWVELKLPEKLTPEQMKGIAPYIPDNVFGRSVPPEVYARMQEAAKNGTYGEHDYVAVDAAGKPIKNAYTNDIARGSTPEEAFLAGQLAREGNSMGHCVGGYCKGVAAGESRIFSLRDPKGQSHVTIETTGDYRTFEYKIEADPSKQDILQIKGKQNRAPNAEYLPYVQDFVKGGKWGDVRDLENTGLNRWVDPNNPAKGTNYLDNAEYLKATGLSVDGNLNPKSLDKPMRIPPGQRGAADPELLAKVAAVGGGAALLAALDEENPETAALLGAGLGYAATKIPWTKGVKGTDYVLGNVSTRIGNISERLKLRMRDFERRTLERQYVYKSLGDKFLIALNNLPQAAQSDMKRALLSGDPAEMAAAVERAGSKPLAAEWGRMAQGLDSIGAELEALGRVKRITGYFPRIVSDLPGLLKALGTQTRSGLEKALKDAEDKAMSSRGEGLNEIERSQIVNNFLLEPLRQGGRPGWSRSRRVQEITDKLEPYYLDPTASFHAYARRASMEIEKARLFGKDAQMVKDPGGLQHLNTQKSIGALVDRELQSGKITQDQALELRQMLRSRFEGGERVSNEAIQAWRNLANIGYLGQVVAAIPQLGDAAMAGAIHGFKPALQAATKVLSSKNELSMKDMGLVDHISEEFITANKLANSVNSVFKWSGFSAVDAFGKNVTLNAARLKFEAQARTAKGQAEIARKYGEAFGEDLPGLLKDLREGKLTDNTKLLYFSELSDMQPISKLEMPQAYLDNPNGRLLYTFKSFMLKQLDLARNKGYNEIKKGNTAEGLKNLTRLGLTLGIAGATTDMIKNFILGKDFDPEWEDIPLNMLKTFGLSQYIMDKARDGRWREAIGGVVGPPTSMFEDLLRRDPKSLKYLPLVGQLLYGHSEEGQAAYEKQKNKEAARKIDRELRPWFGATSQDVKEEIKRRKQELRESR